MNSRRRTITMPRLLPHTIQLCIHCRRNPAGFWVSHNGDQTVRRPWCLSCCPDLDPACHHVIPFDSQNNARAGASACGAEARQARATVAFGPKLVTSGHT